MLAQARARVQARALLIAVVATGVGLVVTLLVNPVGPTLKRIAAGAVWVVPTALVLDLLIAVGATMMIASATGSIVRRPAKAKLLLAEMPERANASRTFVGGFVLATAAAVAWGLLVLGAVVVYLPPSAWAALTFPLVDLMATVLLRRAIWRGIREGNA